MKYLREVWEHEEQDFTPWLLENIDQLASLIGIEIDDVTRETAVGDYTADLVRTEPTTSDPVVIENQFGSTDHDHLGKLLTYAAGIDAGFVVWIAEGFRDEHRSVLDWLNSRDSSGARFFGVRPRIVSVGIDDATFGFEFTVSLNRTTGSENSVTHSSIENKGIGTSSPLSSTPTQNIVQVGIN